MSDQDFLNQYSGDQLHYHLCERIERYNQIAEDMHKLIDSGDHRNEIKSIQAQMKEMFTTEKTLAGFETNDDGKARYSNEAQRELAAKQKLEKSDDYKALQARLKTLIPDQECIDADRRFMETEIKQLNITIPALTAIYERETLITLREIKNSLGTMLNQGENVQ